MPHSAAGCRMEPPVSVPRASAAIPVLTATAEPLEELPGTRARSHGLRVTLYALFSADEPIANSSMFVLPTTIAPAPSSRATAVAVKGRRAAAQRAGGVEEAAGRGGGGGRGVFAGQARAGDVLGEGVTRRGMAQGLDAGRVQCLERLRVGQDLLELACEGLALLGGEGQAGEPGHVVHGLDGDGRHDRLLYRMASLDRAERRALDCRCRGD